jgi:hypothetical protein
MTLNVRALFLPGQKIGKHSMIPNKYGRIVKRRFDRGPAKLRAADRVQQQQRGGRQLHPKPRGGLGKHGITVNALAPGMFATKMTEGPLQCVGQEAFATYVPLRRIGDDEDLKGAALLLASNAGKHITGQTLAIDGGASSATLELIQRGEAGQWVEQERICRQKCLNDVASCAEAGYRRVLRGAPYRTGPQAPAILYRPRRRTCRLDGA